MNIKKYLAPDMRAALRMARDDLGTEAVMLSNRRVGEQVEVVVASDTPDAATLTQWAVSSAVGPAPPAPSTPLRDAGINSELLTLRRLLENQISQLSWNDLTRRAPLAAEVLRSLSELGFARDVCAAVVEALPNDIDYGKARRLAMARLTDQLQVTGERWMEFGGRVALVGATGAGKTTTIGKLAARWVRQHGNNDVALISADSRRLGAHAQLAQVGRLLGVPTFTIEQLEDLPALLARLAATRFVLIDTAGMGGRDPLWSESLRHLKMASPAIEIVLTIAANSHAANADAAISLSGAACFAACVLTKLDESTTLGGSLSTIMRAKLPVSYVCNGHRASLDIRPARAFDLIALAADAAEASGSSADEDMLRHRFAGVAHARA